MYTVEHRNYKTNAQSSLKISADWNKALSTDTEELTYKDFCKRYNLQMIPKFSNNNQN